ncbi:MAG: hypothetical protein Q4G58_17340 [bacterium]|nr:hypothetical protein [bacterium]
MSIIRPIEKLTMAPKSLTTSIQNVKRLQLDEMTEEEYAANFRTKVKQNAKQTVETQKGEQNEYRYDQKKEGNGGGYQSKKRDKKKEEIDDPDDISKRLGQSFDFRI